MLANLANLGDSNCIMSERTVSPAVYGVETEYSCMLTLPGEVVHEIVGSCHSVDVELGLYVEPTQKGSSALMDTDINAALAHQGILRNPQGMLSNGARFYIDPSGPEYATAETASAEDAVLRVFEGDQIVLRFFDRLREQGIILGSQTNRKIVDHNRSSRGIHLNNLTKLTNKSPSMDVQRWLATLNVAKGALFGSGGLLVNEDGQTEFHHSPRLSITTDFAASYGSYKLRPLVRKPFKPDGERLGRVETITSDALNFGWPLRASLVATNAVIGVIELGYGNKLPELVEQLAISSAHNVGLYGSDGIMHLHDGDDIAKLRSLDVLREIVEVVFEVDYIEQHLDKESDQVLGEIIDIADMMADDPYSVVGQVESMARFVAMQKKMDAANISIDSERMCRFDYAWDWIGGGIAETLRNGRTQVGWHGFRNLPSPRAQKKRLVTPPQDTRAKLRGDAIIDQGGFDTSNWSDIDFGTRTEYIHPLQTQVPDHYHMPKPSDTH